MADQRADLSTRIAAPDEWDAGFHTDSEVGAIDVGLSVQPRAVGVVVDAPGVGTLRVAFDVGADGTTRLARASRKLGDGREAPFVAVDEAQVLRLEGELRRAREEYETELAARQTALTERDARISALEAEGFAQKSELESVTTERDARQAALELAHTEVAAASERLTALELERDTLRASSAQLGDRDGRIAALESQVSTLLDRAKELEAERDDLLKRLAESVPADQFTEREARITALEAERNELRLKVEASAPVEQLAERDAKLTALEAERDELRTRLEASAPADQLAERDARISALETERDALKTQLASAVPAEQLAAAEQERATSSEQLRERAARITALETERDELKGQLEKAAPSDQLTERDSRIAALETERDELKGQLEKAAPSDQLTERDSRIAALETERDALKGQLAGAVSAEQLSERDARITSLESELSTLNTHASEAEVTSTDRITTLETELQAATSRAADLEAQLATLTTERDALAGKQSEATGEQAAVIERLEKRVKELQQAEAAAKRALAEMVPLAELENVRSELEKLRNDPELATMRDRVSLLESDLGRREESLAMAVARSDALQGQLASLETQLTEAREVAVSIKAQSDKALAERDEARNVARSLHQRLSAGAKGTRELSDLNVALGQERQIAANLMKEKETLTQKIEALGRMIEQERNGRAQALAERDEWQSRFKALAKGATDTSQPLDLSREETRSYTLEQPAAELPTHPEIPAVKGPRKAPTSPGDATDPMITKPKGK